MVIKIKSMFLTVQFFFNFFFFLMAAKFRSWDCNLATEFKLKDFDHVVDKLIEKPWLLKW